MTLPRPGEGWPAGPGIGKIFENFTGFPSPEKIYAELQRLNNNIEIMYPDLHKLANALEKLQGDDIQNLSAALNSIRAGDILRTLNEFTGLAKQIYERLWGKT